MDFGLSTLLGGALGGVTGLLGGLGQQDTAKHLAQEQMAFQERMANTQWQRTVTDMKAAGINPMLAIQQGPNAAPGGALGQAVDVGGAAANSAMGAMRMAADLKIAAAQKAKIDQETLESGARTLAQTNELPDWMFMKGDSITRFGFPSGTFPRTRGAYTNALLEAQANSARAAARSSAASAALDEAALPGMKLRGSTFGTAMDMILRSAFGSIGLLPGAAGAKALLGGGKTMNRIGF